jgi:L-lysine 6-transaminase
MLDEMRRYVVTDPWPFVVDLASSRGMWLATVDGQRLFDWTGWYGSKLLSHNHPGLVDADYLRRLTLAANHKTANPDFLTPFCLDYYRLLHQLAPACMRGHPVEVYAVNSGAEAVENMLKYLLNMHDARREASGRPRVASASRRFIYFDNAFHGRTVFALNITSLDHDPIVTEDFAGLVPGNLRVPFPASDSVRTAEDEAVQVQQSLAAVEACLQQFGEEVVGIIVEPIQGAGGHRVTTPTFFRALSELAHRYGTFLAFDEVQTAGGQTGTVFAIDQFDLPYPPQAVATGKKFGNGVVYMLATMRDMGVLDSTWGGSLTDMVRVVREFEIVRADGLIERVPDLTRRLVAGLCRLAADHADLIDHVRGMGLYQGFTCASPDLSRRLRDTALSRHSTLLLSAGPRAIRLRPPLDVAEDDIDRLLSVLDVGLRELPTT